MRTRLHMEPYQEVIMRKRENEANSHLVKIVDVSCGGHMITLSRVGVECGRE